MKTILATLLFATLASVSSARAEKPQGPAWDDPKGPVELGLPASTRAAAPRKADGSTAASSSCSLVAS